jgi:hypothetical protein
MSTCPQGVAWCEQHDVLIAPDDGGQPVEFHTARLFTRYAPVQPSIPSTALTACDCTMFSAGLGIALQQATTHGQSLTPEDARELAAALIRGAELVEAARSATCPSCGCPAAPGELASSEDGRLQCLEPSAVP